MTPVRQLAGCGPDASTHHAWRDPSVGGPLLRSPAACSWPSRSSRGSACSTTNPRAGRRRCRGDAASRAGATNLRSLSSDAAARTTTECRRHGRGRSDDVVDDASPPPAPTPTSGSPSARRDGSHRGRGADRHARHVAGDLPGRHDRGDRLPGRSQDALDQRRARRHHRPGRRDLPRQLRRHRLRAPPSEPDLPVRRARRGARRRRRQGRLHPPPRRRAALASGRLHGHATARRA